jgi:mono/diheme cytochrome c family protein
MKNSILRAGLAVVLLGMSGAAVQAAGASRSASSGVYTAEQAVRGKVAFATHCASCHGATLTGGSAAPALTGKTFLYSWTGLTVGDLGDRIHTTMPADNPGSLDSKAVADVTAYILSMNRFPAGKAELPVDLPSEKTINLDGKKSG